MYHYVVTAHNDGHRLQTPLDGGTYHYMFGDDFLVAPIFIDSKINSISLPEGKWRYFFEDKKIFEGEQSFEMKFPMDEYPVFVKEGAIIPMDIKRDYTKIGDKNSEGFSTILIYPTAQNSFTFYHLDSEKETEIYYDLSDLSLQVRIAGFHIPHILNIHSGREPISVELDGALLSRSDVWNYDSVKQKLIVKTNDYKNGNYIIKY